MCFNPETHPRNLNIREYAEITNNITTPPSSTSSSGPHHERVADPRSTAVASCSIGGCDPSSVITASLDCAVHACGVSRVWRAPRKVRVRIFGNMYSTIVRIDSLRDKIFLNVTQVLYRVVSAITVSHAARQDETSFSQVASSFIKIDVKHSPPPPVVLSLVSPSDISHPLGSKHTCLRNIWTKTGPRQPCGRTQYEQTPPGMSLGVGYPRETNI